MPQSISTVDLTPARSGPGERQLRHLPSVRSALSAAVYGVALLGLFLVSAEATARVQDWMTRGTPLTAVPYWDRDLVVETPSGKRGRPNGRYQKWVLNEYGFRGGSISMTPTSGTTRLMILGSSETFGLYESPGKEFPASLADRVSPRFEVVNAAMTGMTLGSTVLYWQEWASRFSPAIVIIYPSPFFYLNEGVLGDNRRVQSAAARGAASRPERSSLIASLNDFRLVQRAREQLDVPDFIQRWRDQRTIDAATAGKPAGWLFDASPADRVSLLIRDLEALVVAIRNSGGTPIVMTHASRFTDPPRERDLDWLERSRVNTPRATTRAIVQFETAVNVRLLDWARASGVEVIDIRPAVAGRDELFGDLIHFNDAGAAAVAAEIAAHLNRSPALNRPRAMAPRTFNAVQ